MVAAVSVMAISVAALTSATPAQAGAPYEVQSFSATTTNGSSAPYTQAGGHLSQNDAKLVFADPYGPLGPAKDAAVTLLPGFFGNPAAVPRCPSEKILSEVASENDCPPGSIVGTAGVNSGGDVALYNVIPDSGYPAQFGFRTIKGGHFKFLLSATLLPRTEDYGLSVGATNIPQNAPINGDVASFRSTFFGVPTQHGSGTTEAPFLTNPLDCSEANPAWTLVYDSWFQAGAHLPDGRPDFSDPNWHTATEPAAQTTGCDDPALADQFNLATIATKPLQPGGGPVQADQPTGLAVDLDFPQSNDPTDLETEFDPSIPQAPEPKDITVTLPAGLAINPSSAGGLGACSDLASDPAGDQVHYDSTNPVSCPDSSIIGTAVALSPLLALHDSVDDHIIGPEPIPGNVYLLAPHPGDLPVGGGSQAGKFRLLIQLENERYGINFKLPGIATADPNTGQLTATFTQNPQLPASHITVNLKEGPRAPLATPVTCGGFGATSDIVPWSTPGTPDAHPSASFNVGSGPNGTPCPLSAANRPFAPSMSAGTASNQAGQSSPFNLHLARADGEGELSALDVTLPKGLAAKFIGVPYCPEAALASAATKSGSAEQASPSCPAASRIGAVTVGAGPGSSPFYAHGNAYLSGPYKSAPMSVSVITPAVAGPFDLGTVVSRNALFIDPETAQGHVVSDPLPTILDGVPLRLRSIDVRLDRPHFTFNPTNCEPQAVQTTIRSTDGAAVSPSNFFQAGDCKALGFKPRLSLALKGGTRRSSNPALTATVTYPKGAYANIAFTSVTLPHSEFLDNAHIRNPCTRVIFAEGSTPGERCPASSVIGFARAQTPLLDEPLEGPVYLRSSSHKLPDVVAALAGQIFVELDGRIDAVHERLRTTFENVPDAPVSKFTLSLFGAKKGLLVNSENLCRAPQVASVKMVGQNDKVHDTKPLIGNDCKKSRESSRRGARHR